MKRLHKICCLLIVAIFVLSTTAGCGGKTSSVSAGSTGTASSAPKKDTLKVAFTSEPPSLTTYDHDSLISVGMNNLTYNGLVRIDNGTLEPVLDLAESYDIKGDVEWTFKLRQGVKFHNDDDFTADDVVATINYVKTIPGSVGYTSNIAKVEAIDKYTVKLTTATPYAGLLYDLGYHYNYIMPKGPLAQGNDFNKNPIGTGPYKLSNWVYGNELTFVAFDNYFDPAHKAKIKTLKFTVIPEGASRAIALEAGEVDFVWEVNGADVAKLKANNKIKVEEINSVDNVVLGLNLDKAPLNSADFRNAINCAINRKDIIGGALNGFGMVNYSAISMGYAESTQRNAATFDLDKAKEYLKAWGGDPASVTLPILCTNETRVGIATIIQSNLAKIGIKAEVVPMDTATNFAKMNSGDYVASIFSWSPSNALTYVTRYHSERRKSKPGVLNDPEVDAMVVKAKATLDTTARKAIIEDIVARVNTLSPQPSLYQSVWFRAHDANLAGVVCSGSGYASFQDMYWK